jgi:hypothetical protein
MPICKICNKKFACRIFINGKQRILTQRRRCLECNPYLDRESYLQKIAAPSFKTCRICKKQFRRPKYRAGSVCSACSTTRRRRQRKAILVEHKGGKCERCGYNKCLKALHFHHKDEKEKSFQIVSRMNSSLSILKLEVEKCELLCANCHAEEHDKMLNADCEYILQM